MVTGFCVFVVGLVGFHSMLATIGQLAFVILGTLAGIYAAYDFVEGTL